MATIKKITRIYQRRYRDTGQVVTYVEWIDGTGQKGRTEGSEASDHMIALIKRGRREGVHMCTEDF